MMQPADIRLALKSLGSRRLHTMLTISALALSFALMLAMTRLKDTVRHSFEQAVSGVDLIVGSRGSALELLLHAVFHMGQPTSGVRSEIRAYLDTLPEVDWHVPVALGDSHKGFAVVATTPEYFTRISPGVSMPGLTLGDTEVVLGQQVALQLGYAVGDSLILAHGSGEVVFEKHDQHPFYVKATLPMTGTPGDHSVFISVEALHALHEAPLHDHPHPHDHAHDAHAHDAHADHRLSAVFVRLKDRSQVLSVQHKIQSFVHQPLSAVMPGVTLHQLWKLFTPIEVALTAMGALVFAVTLMVMLLALASGLAQRSREVALLRTLGAGPGFLLGWLIGEVLCMVFMGCILGWALVTGALYVLTPWAEKTLSLHLDLLWPRSADLWLLGLMSGVAVVCVLIPLVQTYRRSLGVSLSL